MNLVQEIREELITRHHLALDALDRQAEAIAAAETLADRLRERGVDAHPMGHLGEQNRVRVFVRAHADSRILAGALESLALDHDLIGKYEADKDNNPGRDIYRIRAAGQEVILDALLIPRSGV